MRMIERRDRASLLFKAGASFRSRRDFRRKELERDETPQPKIAGLIDHAHAAFAKFVENLVMGDYFANHAGQNSLLARYRKSLTLFADAGPSHVFRCYRV